MSVVSIYRERLPYHPLLGRNVNLDSRSKRYAVQPVAATVTSVLHTAHIGILDQDNVGGCTGFASTACAYREPFTTLASKPWRYSPDSAGGLAWYHDNTVQDDYPGTYSPDDTGSDGLTSSKVAREAGVCSGYQAALDLDSSLLALMAAPGITGIPWYSSMFNPPPSGLLDVNVQSPLAGGHELCVDEIVAADAPGNGVGELLVGGPNSWGVAWGATGRWYLRASDWWELRKRDGDVYFWTPSTTPAPTPAPEPSDPIPSMADRKMWAATAPFRHDHHVVPHIVQAAKALNAWGAKMGLDHE